MSDDINFSGLVAFGKNDEARLMTSDAIRNREAITICEAALEAHSITRKDYNIVRRSGRLMDQATAEWWWKLSGAIWNHQIAIIEDGENIVEVALSFDKTGNCNGVCSL